MTADLIKQKAEHLAEETVALRHHLHAHPELSFQEEQTSAWIRQKLEAMGLEVRPGLGGHGLVAHVKGTNPDKAVVALRADMDALPIAEANDVPYKSKNPGVMHACGHDVHSSSLLSTAKILSEMSGQFEGTVKLIFQHAEEKLPGGASQMIAAGALENPRARSIIGQHVMPLIDTGKVGFRSGPYMASADELYFTVKGKGGHAAMPHHNVDPVLIASHIIVSLQQIVSRFIPPIEPAVVSFGRVEAYGATNVIPEEVKVQGTFRMLNEEWREKAAKHMTDMAQQIAKSMGGECDFRVQFGYPHLKNEPKLTERTRAAAVEYLGEENVVDLDIWMAGEDFAYYSQEMDACFYRLGTRNEAKGITSMVHTPTFDIDEAALAVGPGLMAHLALAELKSQ